ncbi:GNAT family N-acetyltransferase [Enterococcus sp. HY326]|uniref:GNAT family N-acetyltransferase n=1 Tax=Enterococcus sp. HY326 TaxID=2971265 RepID=UPI002240B8CA|nr:GNAT family N-acetyltransferase [Enterococcus sp. HY326]
MKIRRYQETDIQELFALMTREGEEWTYNSEESAEKYELCMSRSIAFVVEIDGQINGYIRCKNDDGFGVYVLDLLVDQRFRGRQIGRQLIEQVQQLHPNDPLYITSDADGYYQKQGYQVVGTIFEVS